MNVRKLATTTGYVLGYGGAAWSLWAGYDSLIRSPRILRNHAKPVLDQMVVVEASPRIGVHEITQLTTNTKAILRSDLAQTMWSEEYEEEFIKEIDTTLSMTAKVAGLPPDANQQNVLRQGVRSTYSSFNTLVEYRVNDFDLNGRVELLLGATLLGLSLWGTIRKAHLAAKRNKEKADKTLAVKLRPSKFSG